MTKSKFTYAIAFFAIFLQACSDNNEVPDEPLGDYEQGYFVTNEGPFQNGSGTITFIADNGQVSQNVYKTVNNEDLGNIVNSMAIIGEKGYIVVNNSNKVVVVNRNTMEKEAEIKGNEIINPRFFVAYNGKGYISNWGDPLNANDDFITVVSLETNAVLNTIPVGEGPEKMIINADKLYVCLQGGFGSNNQVVVVATSDDSIQESLTVGDVPNSIKEDSQGNLWVLCGGKPSWTGNETPGFLYKIVPGNNSVSSFEFDSSEHPSLLNSDNGKLYYSLNGEVFQMDDADDVLPVTSLTGLGGFYYSMNVRNGELYATDAADYASEGSLKVFAISSGSLLETIATGIIPGQVVFP